MSDNSIFMRVDEVAKVLDVSESYAYKIIKKPNKELAEKGKIVVLAELIASIFTKELTAQIKQKEDKNACI